MTSREFTRISSIEGALTRIAMLRAVAVAILTTALVLLLVVAAKGGAYTNGVVKGRERTPGRRRHRHANG